MNVLIQLCLEVQILSRLIKETISIKKKKHRPISILFVISKIFEGCLFDQIYKTKFTEMVTIYYQNTILNIL